ncbi:MAG TPA: hydroxysqualene dehydroxylase HpnE [Candidatus Polarisedimenticolia bacterium]|nr:hydroxysqualene dehydroxylase HpnE [Candidatus Polarisedimenticolia bacterium]
MGTEGVTGSPDAIVVGGGFAGLAAATALVEAGARVVLLEGRPHLGGRARSWVDPETGTVIDNGQHLFTACYRETLRFLDRIGTGQRLEIQPRLSLPFVDPGGRVGTFRLPTLPSSWSLVTGLLRYPGLGFADRLRLLRVAREVKRRSPRPPVTSGVGPPSPDASLDQRSVAEWLASLGQSEEARRRLWYPLTIAALNEDPETASAAMFLPVLRESFQGGAGGSGLGLAGVGLSELYAEPGAHYIKSHGSEVRLRAQVRRLVIESGRCAWVLLEDGGRVAAGAVVSAVPPADLLEMLSADTAADPFFAGAARLETSPIVSIYLWFGSPVTDLPFAGLLGGTWQWIFNRHTFAGKISGVHPVTLVCSAARSLVEMSRERLVRLALDDLHRFFPSARRATLRHALVIKEKRATISPARGALSLRPPFLTPYKGLHLAGDWTATGLPATIEGAVLSGHACARQVALER